MRIRTIKPYFWKHPLTGRLSGDAKWLAVALLNVADDEGYFHADEYYLRGEVDPFAKDTKTISKSLDELANIEFIKIVTHPKMGKIGRICKFKEHQVINRPTSSSIKGYYLASNTQTHGALSEDSLTTHTQLTDDSLPEGKGKEGNGMERNRIPSLEEWLSYSKEIGFDESNAEQTYNWYQSNGWRVGKNPMKDWKACVRTCHLRNKPKQVKSLTAIKPQTKTIQYEEA